MLSSMRALPLLLVCLSLGACAGVHLPGAEAPPAPQASASPPPAAEPPPAAAAPSRSSRRNAAGGGTGARGGASTAAARAPEPAEPLDPGVDPLTQARADCWMKVESNKGMRGIDQRAAFVDKCVADRMKGAN